MINLIYGFIFIFITVTLFSQDVNYSEEFQVNSFTEGDQILPQVASLNDGSFVICWANEENFEFSRSFQIYNSDGTKRGNEIQLSSLYEPFILNLSIASLSNGGFVICYDNGSGLAIAVQIFDHTGSVLVDELNIHTNTEYFRDDPSVTSLPSGGFIISWTSHNGQDGNGSGIFAQFFNGSGIKVGQEFQVNTFTSASQKTSNLTILDNNTIIIVWQSYKQDGASEGVFAQLFDSNGEKIGNEFQVNTHALSSQENAKVTRLNNNRFVVCWESMYQDGSYNGIYAQIFNNNGVKYSNEILVNSYTQLNQTSPCLTNLSNGNFVITWQSYNQDGSYEGIYTQIFNNDGHKVGSEFLINNFIQDAQIQPSICNIFNGKFIITWASNYQDGSEFGVFGKLFYNEPMNHNLSTFVLLKPELDTTINNFDITFSWNKASEIPKNFIWELTYDLYLSRNYKFTNPIVISDIIDTTYHIDSLNPGFTYFWKVLAKNYYGDSLWSSNSSGFYIDPNINTVDKTDDEIIPNQFIVKQNYPNPFNPATKIDYSLPSGKSNYNVSIKVYDVLGRLVAVLFNDVQQPGNYTIEFNGESLSSGIYYYTISADQLSITKKMILLK